MKETLLGQLKEQEIHLKAYKKSLHNLSKICAICTAGAIFFGGFSLGSEYSKNTKGFLRGYHSGSIDEKYISFKHTARSFLEKYTIGLKLEKKKF